jgi:predicted nucleotide-binding protein (sugar kinase/HSP70/actin superfamily)
LYEYKYNKMLEIAHAKNVENARVKVGIPLAMHYYEQMPLWKKFFDVLGFETVVSDESTRKIYYKGQHTIPSDTVCYPAKLTHGHVESLLEKGVDFIFYPCMSFNIDDGLAQNHFNCPIVAYYPELLITNNENLTPHNLLYPFVDLNNRKSAAQILYDTLKKYNVSLKQVTVALDSGFEAMDLFMEELIKRGEEIIRLAREQGKPIIVLCGRPYHTDLEINHGINKLITSLGMAVVSEDAVAHHAKPKQLNVLNQWTFHSRMYNAAAYVVNQPDMHIIQLISFGCGIDAIAADEIREQLESQGKRYTQIKIDEINNLGAAKIRIRSLMATM